LLVSITALLIAGRTDVAAAENSEVAQLATDLDELEQGITAHEAELNNLKTSLGFADNNIAELAQIARKDAQVRKKLGRPTCIKLREFEQISKELQRLVEKIFALENEATNLVISKERIALGFVFALVPCVSSLLVLLHMAMGMTNCIILKERYLALATVSGVCASAAYALLARRKTTEKQFLEDLRGVNTLVQTITDVVNSATAAKQKT
jgi:hypothetical protein